MKQGLSDLLAPSLISNAQLVVNAAMAQIANATLHRDDVRSFSLGEVEGHRIEFAVGRSDDVLADGGDDMMAQFGSCTDLNDPTLWFTFTYTDVGQIIGFRFHDEYSFLEYDAETLAETWAARLQHVAKNLTGYFVSPGGLIDGAHRLRH